MHIYIYVYVYIYTYIHTYIHTYVYITTYDTHSWLLGVSVQLFGAMGSLPTIFFFSSSEFLPELTQ
jgi:hypothetical protein